jgi:hypothetical protein
VGRIVTVVEGHGEVEAVPILIRRIAEMVQPTILPDVSRPIRVPRHRLLKQRELERTVELAARQAGSDGRILILLDADEDCPAQLAPIILARATRARSDRRICVVLPKAEYEAWFLAAADSIAGHRGIRPGATAPEDPEGIRDAKAWLTRRMIAGRSYRETLDQPALSGVFDLVAARRAPSFDKLWRDMESLFA